MVTMTCEQRSGLRVTISPHRRQNNLPDYLPDHWNTPDEQKNITMKHIPQFLAECVFCFGTLIIYEIPAFIEIITGNGDSYYMSVGQLSIGYEARRT